MDNFHNFPASDLRKLSNMLATAPVGNRKLDTYVFRAFGGTFRSVLDNKQSQSYVREPVWANGDTCVPLWPYYTTNLAIITDHLDKHRLVWSVRVNGVRYFATVGTFSSPGATAPLALCAAAINSIPGH